MINATTPAIITNCKFKFNRADSSAGACYLSSAARAKFVGTEFEGNIAGAQGGAMATDSKVKLNLLHCRFLRNIAATFGGALSFAGDSHSVNAGQSVQLNSSFTSNRARHSGGGIYWHTSSLHPLQRCSQCMHLANRVGEAHHSKISTITAYGIDEATDIAQLVYPTSSQHSFVPGIPTSPESFRLDLLDAFGQMVSTTHGSGVRCSLSWDPSVEQVCHPLTVCSFLFVDPLIFFLVV